MIESVPAEDEILTGLILWLQVYVPSMTVTFVGIKPY